MPYFENFLASFLPTLRCQLARGPGLVCLEGALGAGKTTFTRELLAELGLRDGLVQSPTFLKVIEHEIPALGLCVHLDGYRFEGALDYENVGLENYVEAALWIVEWPELFLQFLRARPQLARVLDLKKCFVLKFEILPGGARQVRWSEKILALPMRDSEGS